MNLMFSRGTALSIALTPVLLILAGCVDPNQNSTTNTEITINAESGTKRSLTGTWRTTCVQGSSLSGDGLNEIVISGSSIILNQQTYPTADGTCSGSPTNTLTLIDLVMATAGDLTTIGWVPGAAPMSQLGTASLNPTPTVTKLELSAPLVGVLQYVFFYIDDTATTWCMYRDGGTNLNGDNYSDSVDSVAMYCKV